MNTFRNESNHVDVPRVVPHRRQSHEVHEITVVERAAIVIVRVVIDLNCRFIRYYSVNMRIRDAWSDTLFVSRRVSGVYSMDGTEDIYHEIVKLLYRKRHQIRTPPLGQPASFLCKETSGERAY